ncbi:hypothetical protein GLOTRDRAFT_40361, partial [Gloeophyllum trabeum ATCC 11539]
GLRHFAKGISSISQWTGNEQQQMAHIFIAICTGAVDNRVTKAASYLLNFIHYSQYQRHTSETLALMQQALDGFHEVKDIFVDYLVRKEFNIHSLLHYVSAIRSLGTADGYNTESPEWLHIEYAKKAYHVSNKRDYEIQMTRWLQRQDAEDEEEGSNDDEYETLAEMLWVSHLEDSVRIARRCPHPNLHLADLEHDYSAVDFLPALCTFLVEHYPDINVTLSHFDVFNMYKTALVPLPPSYHFPDNSSRYTRIHAVPIRRMRDPRKADTPAHFDTVLAMEDRRERQLDPHGMRGLRIAEVRVIFTLPPELGGAHHQEPLAYVHWYRPLQSLDPVTTMYKLVPSTHHARPNLSIIRVSDILRTCHLAPKYGSAAVRSSWTSTSGSDLLLNKYIDLQMFDMLCPHVYT